MGGHFGDDNSYLNGKSKSQRESKLEIARSYSTAVLCPFFLVSSMESFCKQKNDGVLLRATCCNPESESFSESSRNSFFLKQS